MLLLNKLSPVHIDHNDFATKQDEIVQNDNNDFATNTGWVLSIVIIMTLLLDKLNPFHSDQLNKLRPLHTDHNDFATKQDVIVQNDNNDFATNTGWVLSIVIIMTLLLDKLNPFHSGQLNKLRPLHNDHSDLATKQGESKTRTGTGRPSNVQWLSRESPAPKAIQEEVG